MKKSTLLMIVSVVLAMTLSLGGTLAYLSDVDSDVNVMTLGSVYIEQYEHERTDKTTAELEDNLEEFQKNHPHPLFPAIYELKLEDTEWTDGTELKIWTNNNVVDKFVTVENTGKSGAYVRTIFAVEHHENVEYDPVLNWNDSEWILDNNPVTMEIQGGESAQYKVYVVYYKGILAAEDTTAPSLMQVALPCTAGNEDVEAYGDQFDIIVLSQAVQTEGFDSAEAALNEAFGTDPSAWFNGVKYPEDEAAGAADDLMDILANAEKGAPLYITLTGNVEYPTEATVGVKDITKASSVVIDGQNQYKITFTGSGVSPVGDDEAPLTLKNLTVVDESESYAESSWEYGYLEMGGPAKFLCENVTFENAILVHGNNAFFNNCTFKGIGSEYGVWVYNGNATFTNCSFVGDRGLKICDMYNGAEVASVVVDKCTFNGLTKKPGVAIDNYEGTEERKQSNEGMSVVIKNSTFINCQPGDRGLYIYETDNVVPTLDNNAVLNYDLAISTADELVAFAKDVNEKNNSYNGKTVMLLADINLAGIDWEPIGQTGNAIGDFMGVFDGQGHTIYNLTVDSEAETNGHYSSGLFGWVESSTHVTIKNVTVDGANIKGHHNVAVIAGYLEGNAVIENCHVKNAVLSNTNANKDANGDKTGAIAGYAADTTLINKCSAKDVQIESVRDAGQIVGAATTHVVVDCEATNVTVKANGTGTGVNINEALIGRVL